MKPINIIATTNYPEQLAPNLVDRPRRFSTICFVDYPTKEQKVAFLRHKNISEKDIEDIIKGLGKDTSMDYVREVLLLSRLENKPFVETIQNIKSNRRLISKTFRGTIGLHQKGGNKPKMLEGS